MMQLVEDARRAADQKWQEVRRASNAPSSSTSFVCVALPQLAEAPAPSRRRSSRRAPGAMFASATMSSPSDAGDDQESPFMSLGPSLAIGTRGRKKGAVLTDPEDIKELKEHIDSLSPEDREKLRQLAHKQLINSVKTEDGKPLFDEAVRMQKELQDQEMGIGQPTLRQLPRYQQDILIRPDKLRPGAEKMQLRKWEEDKMELEFMGNGNVYSSAPLLGWMLGGRRDFAYGVYANTKKVPEVLADKWAKKDQLSVITTPQFYRDIILWAPAIELTLMVIPSRDLPVQEAVAKLGPIMEKAMMTLEPQDSDKKSLSKFLGMFGAPHLQGAKFLGDNNGPTLKQGSRLIFSTGSDGQTIVEATNPGKIKDQETYQVHNNFNKKVTYSLFDTFIGDQALDPIAKQAVGKGMSYIANGFSFQLNGNPNQVLVDDPNAPYHKLVDVEDWRLEEEVLAPSRKLFTMLGVKKEAPLVQHIREAQQGNKPDAPPDVLNRQ